MTQPSNANSAANSAYANASKMVTPLRAVVLLYDRALQSALAAREALMDGRVEDRFQHTQKVSQIVTALQGNLDFENGGEISPMLYEFYNTLFRRLQDANLRNSIEAIEDVILALNNVRDSWSQVAERNPATPAPAVPRNVPAPGHAPQSAAATDVSRKPLAISV